LLFGRHVAKEWQQLLLVGARIRYLNECLLHPCFVLATSPGRVGPLRGSASVPRA
jgi:hypothetical protein